MILELTSLLATSPLKRPRGLWKGRHGSTEPRFSGGVPEKANFGGAHDSDTDYDDVELKSSTSSSGSSKRRRLSTPSNSEDDIEYFDYTRRISPQPRNARSVVRRKKIMDTSTTAKRGHQSQNTATCDYEDWEDLKELFARASAQYDSTLLGFYKCDGNLTLISKMRTLQKPFHYFVVLCMNVIGFLSSIRTHLCSSQPRRPIYRVSHQPH